MFVERIVATKEITINYAQGGKRIGGTPFVFLHGLTGSWPEYRPLLEPLAAQWHLFAPDLRGHGRSGRSAGRYQLNDYARDVVALLQTRVSESAVLMGHSLGGRVALAVAAAVPASVRALVLLDPPLSSAMSPGDHPHIREYLIWAYRLGLSAKSFEEVAAACRLVWPDADLATIKRLADSLFNVDPEAVAVMLRDELDAGFDLERALAHITCPTLIVRGERALGSVVRDEDAAFVQAALPAAEIITIPGTGHMVHEEEPELVHERLKAFLYPAVSWA